MSHLCTVRRRCRESEQASAARYTEALERRLPGRTITLKYRSVTLKQNHHPEIKIRHPEIQIRHPEAGTITLRYRINTLKQNITL